jgi:hypothetical protein
MCDQCAKWSQKRHIYLHIVCVCSAVAILCALCLSVTININLSSVISTRGLQIGQAAPLYVHAAVQLALEQACLKSGPGTHTHIFCSFGHPSALYHKRTVQTHAHTHRYTTPTPYVVRPIGRWSHPLSPMYILHFNGSKAICVCVDFLLLRLR